MASITSANAVFMISVASLYPAPLQLQGFSADDIFDVSPVTPVEIQMGLDGKLSAGYIPVAIPQNIVLQADSASNAIFDNWYAAMQVSRDVYFASGVIHLPSINMHYVLTNGVLHGYSPIPDAKKFLSPRRYSITWESFVVSPL